MQNRRTWNAGGSESARSGLRCGHLAYGQAAIAAAGGNRGYTVNVVGGRIQLGF